LHGVLLISIDKLSISQNGGFVSRISTAKASPFGRGGCAADGEGKVVYKKAVFYDKIKTSASLC
jgi:hypothetical protein